MNLNYDITKLGVRVMFSKELYDKYIKTMNDRIELENKENEIIEKWKNGSITLSTESVEKIIEKSHERLENLKESEKALHEDFLKMLILEEQKVSNDTALRTTFGQASSDMKIIDGVLASNAKDSHLVAEKKIYEEMDLDKQDMLSTLKQRVMNGEISLEQASELSSKINSSFDFYSQEKQIEERHK